MLLLWPWSTHGRVLSSEEGENLVGSTCTHPHHHPLDKEGWACELRNQGRLHVMGQGTFWKDDLGAFIRKRGSREAGQVKQFHHIHILSGITSLSPGETHLIHHLPIFGLHDRSKAILKVLKVSLQKEQISWDAGQQGAGHGRAGRRVFLSMGKVSARVLRQKRVQHLWLTTNPGQLQQSEGAVKWQILSEW